MSKRRLRYSLASLAGVIALAAVILSLLMPLLRREEPSLALIHGSFVMTPGNRAQCASCHASAQATVSQPFLARGRNSSGANEILAYLKSFTRPSQSTSPEPHCLGTEASATTGTAQCQQCHGKAM
ncbi:MAG TPA: hypothetical protein VGZ22_09585 [Isosphaeraceae bacterium]|jgi:hypothetical protein|nr:hypothetical protein [Isosphaeraceae bacterium]